jgi:hypothetical protein
MLHKNDKHNHSSAHSQLSAMPGKLGWCDALCSVNHLQACVVLGAHL